MQTIKRLVDEANSIAIIAHTNPDGDTVGCALAMAQVLAKVGKMVGVVCDMPLPQDLSALPNAGIFGMWQPNKAYDLALAVDCSTLGMLGDSRHVLLQARHTACIDHHMMHDNFCEVDWVVANAANAENIYDFLAQYYMEYIDAVVAECLFTALVTDSGGFTHSSVTPHTHLVAAKCLEYGIDNEAICYAQLSRQSMRVLRMRTEAYSHALYEYNNRVAVVVFSRQLLAKYNADIADCAGALVDIMRADELVLAVSMIEFKPHQYKVSVRSKRDVSAAEVCQCFGGGGHRNAAGCRLNGDEGIVIDNLLEACAKVL